MSPYYSQGRREGKGFRLHRERGGEKKDLHTEKVVGVIDHLLRKKKRGKERSFRFDPPKV